MELEDKFLETIKTIKGIAEAIKRHSLEKKNTKVQEQLKELISGFKTELENGNIARGELANKLNQPEPKEVLEKLEKVKDKAITLAKDNKIEWAVCKEYQPKRHRDSITHVLDDVLKKAKEKAEQQNRERSMKKDHTKSKTKEKAPTPTKSR